MQNKSDNLSHVLLTCTYPSGVHVGAGGLEDGGWWGLGVVVVVSESVGEELEEECLVFGEIISSGQTLKPRLYFFWGGLIPHMCFSHSVLCLFINFTEYTLGNLRKELMSIIVLTCILLFTNFNVLFDLAFQLKALKPTSLWYKISPNWKICASPWKLPVL